MTTFVLNILTAIFSLSLVSSFAQAKNAHDNPTAHQAAGAFENLNLADLPVWEKRSLEKRFSEIRDKKFLIHKGEERRVPWLYARDGCHMRSTHFIRESKRLGYEAPKKVFIFGSLEIKGAHIPRGTVEPWFHAAPIVQVDGEPMVLDPAVSFSRPLALETWISLIAKDRDKTVYSICEPETYMQTSSCNNPGPLNMERLEEETQLYLRFEKNILNNLGLSFK